MTYKITERTLTTKLVWEIHGGGVSITRHVVVSGHPTTIPFSALDYVLLSDDTLSIQSRNMVYKIKVNTSHPNHQEFIKTLAREASRATWAPGQE
jgi:hypothetical protein